MEVGDDVRAGDLLAVLEDDEAVLAVESAEAKAVEAGAKLQRFEVLREREVVAPSEYEAALARASRVIGADVKPVVLPFAEAAIDVDKLADYELVKEILAARKPAP